MRTSMTARYLLGTALLAAACASVPPARVTHAASTVTLHMWAWADRKYCAQDFQQSHPNIKVDYTEVPAGNHVSKLIVLKRAGGAGLPDVYFMEVQNMANMYHQGLTTDLSGMLTPGMRAQYAPGTLAMVTFGGKVQALPNDMAALGIWYDPAVLKAAGLTVPTSYDQIYRDAATLAKTKKYAISWFGTDSAGIYNLAWAYHAKWFTQNADGSWTVNIDTPLTERIATQYVDAIRSGGVLPDDPFGPVSGKAFANHTVAYAVTANWFGHYGLEASYPKQTGQWTFMASLPSVGWWGGSAYVVPPQSQHQAEARELALYCSTSPTFQKQTGTVPSYTGVYGVAGAFRPDPYYFDPAQVVAQLKLSAQRTGTGWTFSPNEDYLGGQLAAATTNMVNGASVHAALAKLQQQVVSNLRLQGITVK